MDVHANILPYLPTYKEKQLCIYIHQYIHTYVPTYINRYIHTYREWMDG